ncbi:MAG: Gldg family protein [Verrucomicrobiales bacterium]
MSTETKKSSPRNFNAAWWYSTAGVLVVAVILIGINYIARNVPAQADFTANKFYSLTEGTKKILAKIDTPVDATLFISESKDLPPELVSRVRDVENLLLQYEQNTPRNQLRFKKVYPTPDTEAAEQAALAGVNAENTKSGQQVYFTLSVSCLDKREAVEFLTLIQSGHEEQFEYEVSRAISNVLNDKRKILGVMSALQLSGGGMPNPMMGGGGARPWVFHQQLKRDYDVENVDLTAEKIDDKIDVLLVIHPAGITDLSQFAIDQFLLKGKPVVVMVDPHSIAAKISQGRQNPQMAMMGGGQTSSNLPKLLSNWGYTFDATQVVADMKFKTPLRGNRESPCFLTLNEAAMNKKDIITSQLSDVMFVFAGGFTGKAAEGLTEDILLRTSDQNQLVSPMEAENSDDSIVAKFKASGKEKILAARLTGKFKTAFPDGKPKKDETKKEEEKKPEEKKDEPKDESPPLKEMAEGKTGIVVLVADTDFIYDNFCVQMLGPQLAVPFNSNLPLALNIIDQVGGDTNLVQIRSRGSSRRPFTKINEIEAAANEKIRSRIEELQKKADEANRKLSELQAKKDPKQKNFLSPEQQNEIQEFRKEQADSSRNIRELKKEARKDIDSKLAAMKAWNIVGVPLLVALAGVSVALIRRTRTSAK